MITIDTNRQDIVLTIDYDTLARYEQYYFSIHTKAKKRPIQHPYHESINEWMIMRRPMMNAWKQKWKDFMKWFVEEQGYANLHITRCEISQTIFYPNNRRHDIDNSTPKAILDGLVEGGMIIDDDSIHIVRLTLQCFVDAKHPRTELRITRLPDTAESTSPPRRKKTKDNNSDTLDGYLQSIKVN